MLNDVYEHNKQINDLQLSLDMTMLVSASKDTTAKVGLHFAIPQNTYVVVLIRNASSRTC